MANDKEWSERAIGFLKRLLNRKNERLAIVEGLFFDTREAVYQYRDLVRVDVQREMADLRAQFTEANIELGRLRNLAERVTWFTETLDLLKAEQIGGERLIRKVRGHITSTRLALLAVQRQCSEDEAYEFMKDQADARAAH